jgi:hypothetical protein
MRSTYVVAMALIMSFAMPAFAGDGVFMVVKGDVRVQSKAGGEQKAKVGFKVQEGDTVIAGTDSRAKIVMVDKNVLNISPDTKIAIEKYQFDQAKDNKNVSLNVLYGKVRSTVNQKYDGEKNSFNIKTPSAVAGVRGTDFVTGFNPVTSATKIVTFEGQVMTGSGMDKSGRIMNAVAVNPGQFTVATPGAPPAPPASVPKAELASMNNETKADSPANSDNKGSSRAPADEGGKDKDKEKGDKDGGDKNDKGAKDKGDGKGDKNDKGGDDKKAGPGGDKGGKDGGHSSMGVDSRDMTAESGPAPAGASMGGVPMMDCAACNRPDMGFPQQIPSEFINNGPTKLIINVNQ